jgi:hypothetical protein
MPDCHREPPGIPSLPPHVPVLHFRPSTLRLPIDPVWPSGDVKTPITVFSERPPLRTLLVAIDHEIAD